MTNDPVDQILEAYLDHLETGAPEPSLGSLEGEDRERARELIELIRISRGVNVRRSRPSLDALLAGTEFEGWLDESQTAADSDPFETVRAEVESMLGPTAIPRRDVEALQENVRSDAVLVYRGVRLRMQFRSDLGDGELSSVDPRSAAGPVFGRFPETVGVILVLDDVDLSSVAINPYDVDTYVGAPDGTVHAPAIVRPILPLRDTLKLYVDEVAPDLSVEVGAWKPPPVDPVDIVDDEVRLAIASIVAEGEKAKIPAKIAVFSDFAAHTDDVTSLVAGVVRGEIAPDDLQLHIDRLTPSAA